MKIFWFIRQSLQLDLSFIQLSNWSYYKKYIFLFIKYFLILKHFFVEFNLPKNYVNLFGQKIYYDSKYGLAGYQSMLARPKILLDVANVKELKNAIDIGANVGFYTMMLHNYYENITTYSFEPAPTTFDCLKRNLNNFKNANYYNIGLSDKCGTSKFSFDSQDSAVSHISKDGNIEVTLSKLDDFTKENKINSLDLLKIDTESFEHLVLKGAIQTLKFTKYLMIEVTIKDNNNYTFTDIMCLLNNKDFNYQLVALRNYSDKSQGDAPILDMLFINTHIS